MKIISTRNLKKQEGMKSNQRGNVGQNINEHRIYKTVIIISGVIKVDIELKYMTTIAYM